MKLLFQPTATTREANSVALKEMIVYSLGYSPHAQGETHHEEQKAIIVSSMYNPNPQNVGSNVPLGTF